MIPTPIFDDGTVVVAAISLDLECVFAGQTFSLACIARSHFVSDRTEREKA
jgi:hypothetical protein